MKITVTLGFVALIGIAQIASTPRRWSDRGGPREPDQALISFVNKATGPDDVVLIVGDGQWFGHQVRRPTLAVPARSFSGAEWDEPMIRGLVAKYHVRLVVVNRNPEGTAAVDFAERLRLGPAPVWLRKVEATPAVEIYETVGTVP